MKTRLTALMAILFSAAHALLGEGPDDKYVHVYDLIQEADALNEGGNIREAVVKYMEAQTGLRELLTANPGWNDKVVNYRLNYIAAKLAPMTLKDAATNASPAKLVADIATPGPIMTNQLKALQQEIVRLSAQNALLEAKLKEALSVQPAAVDPRELAKAQEKIRTLEKEKALLQASLEQEQTRMLKPADPAIAEQERLILAEARQKLAVQTALAAGLQKENQDLKQQIAELKSASPAAAATGDSAQQLQAARATIAALQATNTALRADQILLETRVADLARSSKRGGKSKGSDNAEQERQLRAALAKLAAYEAKQVPYTPEELVFFKQPDLNAVVVGTAPTKKKPVELPPGTGPLVEEANRAVDAGRLEEAEKKYTEVLRQDPRNVYTLANLAVIQVDLRHLGEAEKNLKTALAVDPQDPASLYTLGRLKMIQEKYDEALEALSLSAKLMPDQARTQYWLGKVLLQKGNRGAAEIALRKAIQLRPGWGEAHFSLAVVYASQQPPFKELAQWHYQRAISVGYPRDLQFEKMVEEPKTSAAIPQ